MCGCIGKLGNVLLTDLGLFKPFPKKKPQHPLKNNIPKVLFSSKKTFKTSIEDQSQERAMEMDSWRFLLRFSGAL